MSRSRKKGYYVATSLRKKVDKLNQIDKKEPIQTYSRRSTIDPSFIGHTFMVHNGKNFIPVYITKDMLDHKLGEFAKTRTFRGHKDQRAKNKK